MPPRAAHASTPMKIIQRKWTKEKGWTPAIPRKAEPSANLILAFGGRELLSHPRPLEALRAAHPGARIVGCSTSGEIEGTVVSDDTLVATEIRFEKSGLRSASVRIESSAESRQAGRALAGMLPLSIGDGGASTEDPLLHVFVLSDGLRVNGSELVRGLAEVLPPEVTVTGGLAGDGTRFGETLVFCDCAPEKGLIAVVGFYGRNLRIGCASLGGWDSFGPERLVTRSRSNVLFELDGQSVLGLYRKYLGDHAAELPASGLLFPLSLRNPGETGSVVRTLLSIDEKEQSMTFAGDVPEGAYARLMKANFDRLIDGAVGAARKSVRAFGGSSPELAVLISCVGRKLVLRQRVEDEVEGVRQALGPQTVLAGFYSYGEIAPAAAGTKCELHNQTMTVTTFSEI